MKSKLGIQTQWDSGEALRYNLEVQPAAVMGINVVKSTWWQQIALDNPGVKRIYRHHPNSDALGLIKWMDDPESAATDFVAFLRGHLLDTLDHVDLVAGDNEFILGPDHELPNRIEKADRFMAAFVQEADLLLNRGVCVGNFNVGHWGPETVDHFPRTLTAIQAQAVQGERLSYFCFHEYNWPLLRDNTHWYTSKFLRAMPPILERYPDVRCMITEVGIDKASIVWGEHAGWRRTHDDIGVAVDMFCGDHGLAWYNNLLNQTDYVAAVLIFGCGMGDWRAMGFDIMDNVDDVAVLNRIKQFPVVAPPEPPPPEPPNGSDDMIKVFNIDGVELFDEAAADLIAYHGITVHEPMSMRPDEWYWAGVKMEEREGPAAFIYTGLLEDGSPAAEQEAAWAWADDMGEADDIQGNSYPTDWQKEADLGDLNENGNMGPGFGQHGWDHVPYEPGPGRAWIRDPLRWSVLLTGIGWLAMTNHRTMYATWQLKQWEGGEEPPPPTDGDLLAEVEKIGIDVGKIREILEGGYVPPPSEPEVFQGKYFNNVALSGTPVLVREDEEIDFLWGDGSPAGGIPADGFSVRWTGKRTFEAGLHRFHVMVDDGIRLWVDGNLLIDAWKDQPPTLYQADVVLSAGQHDIRVDYYERGGDATCKVWWEKL